MPKIARFVASNDDNLRLGLQSASLTGRGLLAQDQAAAAGDLAEREASLAEAQGELRKQALRVSLQERQRALQRDREDRELELQRRASDREYDLFRLDQAQGMGPLAQLRRSGLPSIVAEPMGRALEMRAVNDILRDAPEESRQRIFQDISQDLEERRVQRRQDRLAEEIQGVANLGAMDPQEALRLQQDLAGGLVDPAQAEKALEGARRALVAQKERELAWGDFDVRAQKMLSMEVPPEGWPGDPQVWQENRMEAMRLYATWSGFRDKLPTQKAFSEISEALYRMPSGGSRNPSSLWRSAVDTARDELRDEFGLTDDELVRERANSIFQLYMGGDSLGQGPSGETPKSSSPAFDSEVSDAATSAGGTSWLNAGRRKRESLERELTKAIQEGREVSAFREIEAQSGISLDSIPEKKREAIRARALRSKDPSSRLPADELLEMSKAGASAAELKKRAKELGIDLSSVPEARLERFLRDARRTKQVN